MKNEMKENKKQFVQQAIEQFLDAGYGVIETTSNCGHLIISRGETVVNYYPTTKTYYSNKSQNESGRAIRGKGIEGALKLLRTGR